MNSDWAARSARYGRNEAMKTRQEHIEELAGRSGETSKALAGVFIDYAIEQGMPVAPEQVEPKVGDTLTEATRLVDGMIVEAGTEAARYAADERLWAATGCADPLPTSSLAMDVWRVVFVPGEPVTEQKHETVLYADDEITVKGPRSQKHETRVSRNSGTGAYAALCACGWASAECNEMLAGEFAEHHKLAEHRKGQAS